MGTTNEIMLWREMYNAYTGREEMPENPRQKYLRALATETAREGEILGLDGDALGVDGGKIGVLHSEVSKWQEKRAGKSHLKQRDEVGLGSLLESHDGG
jgi:hypothetical protein